MFYIDLYKVFLCETTSLGALILGMLHYLVVVYQVCSYYGPIDPMGQKQPVLGTTCFI